MAVLPTQDRASLHAEQMRESSNNRDQISLTKAQVLAAIDAVDNWIEANSASFNAALPVAARNGLTTKQKVELFVRVLRRRYEVT